MSKILAVHSFRGGTGKSTAAANLAVAVAQCGYRVGIIDTDIQSPGIHYLFGLNEEGVGKTLNDYLWGRCPIEETAYDLRLDLKSSTGEVIMMSGGIYLTPSSLKANEATRIAQEGYNVELLINGIHQLVERLELDYLFIDTHPGLNQDTLLSLAVADTLIIVMRPEQRDFQGTAVTVEIARRLEVPHITLIVNNVLEVFDFTEVRTRVEQAYGCPVSAVLPHTEEMMIMGGTGVFILWYPDHPVTAIFKQVAANLIA
jgi:MinD-like ATPase involved in chromosome partitioning or flagellar assembly